MSTQPHPATPSPLITGVGAAHVVYGLVFLGLGVWCLAAGADAVTRTILAGQEVKKVGQSTPGLSREQAGQFGAATDTASKGIAGIFVALAGVAAGCFMIQGLPLVLIGGGVIRRRRWARTFALLLAVLAALQGLGLLAAPAAKPPVRVVAAALLLFAIVTLVVLLSKRAALEFSGVSFVSETAPVIDTAPRRGFSAAQMGVAVTCTAAMAVGAVLAFQRLGGKQTPAPPDPKSNLASFHKAVERGRVSEALECNQAGVHVDDRDDQGETALLRAAGQGHSRMVVLLLALGAQLNEKDEQGRTPLIHAAAAGHGAVVNLLLGKEDAVAEIRFFRDSVSGRFPSIKIPDLKHGKLDVSDFKPFKDGRGTKEMKELLALPLLFRLPKVELDARDREGRSALMLAARGGHVEIIKQLVKGASGKTAQQLATAARHKDIAEKLEAYYRDNLNSRGGHMKAGYQMTALEWAAEEGDAAVVEGLLKRKASQNPDSSSAYSPLVNAAEKGHVLVVRALLDSFGTNHAARLAELTRNSSGGNAASHARRGGQEEIAALLEKEETRAREAVAKQKPATPTLVSPAGPAIAPELVKAIAADDIDAVQAHLVKGGLDGADSDGRNALMLAAARGHRRLVLLLAAELRRRAQSDLFAQDKQGRTALIHAAVNGHAGAVESMLIVLETAWEEGRQNWFLYHEHADRSGKTALDHAKAAKHVAVVKALEVGFKRLLNDHSSRYSGTAVDLASQKGDLALLKRLLARGASVQPGTRKDGSAAESPLMRAAGQGHTEVVRRLLASFGKDHEARLKYVRLGEASGYTAAFYAASEGRSPALRLLLGAFGKENVARVLHVSKLTAAQASLLHVAASKGHLLVVQALLEAFGDDKASCQVYVNSKARNGINNYDETPLALAGNHGEIVTLLRRYGATK